MRHAARGVDNIVGVIASEDIVCIAEDRVGEETGVRLLIRSLTEHCPGTRVLLWSPCASDAMRSWLGQFAQVELQPGRVPAGTGWNVKASVLLAGIARGGSATWWVDSDVIVTCDFVRRYALLPHDVMLVAEEALYGNREDGGLRAAGWGFQITRRLPFALNSGVVRVSAHHVPLLEEWQKCMATDAYVAAQAGPLDGRPIHLLGDQDVLTALLSGPRADVVVRPLLRGRDVIQYFGPYGYTPAERIRTLVYGLPAFIHCQGPSKPWRRPMPAQHGRWRAAVDALQRELSPYVRVAERYAEETATEHWKANNPPTAVGSLIRMLTRDSVPLQGFALSLALSVLRLFRLRRKKSAA